MKKSLLKICIFFKKFIGYLKSIKYQRKYKKSINVIRRESSKRKIKIAFLTMYISDCQCFSLFEKMMNNSSFDPFFIVNPDISRSRDNLKEVYNRCKETLISKYGERYVLDGYDFNNEACVDFTNEFDLCITNNPYDVMAGDVFKSYYWAKKGIPLMYISYYYFGRDKDVSSEFLHSNFFNNLWVYFAENDNVYKWIKKESWLKGKNVYVTGYPKLDSLKRCESKLLDRKRIIIAPHHTIGDISVGNFSIGSFLDTSDVIFNLPKKYPNIDFVFRPHPLLFENLRKDIFWGKEKANKWLEEFCALPNVEYSTEGDYFDLFINSSALIHDCGSFTAEYLCTQHPCAYMVKKGLDENRTFTDFGKKCIHSHYLINSEADVYSFIDDVVINQHDYMKKQRNNFAKNTVMFNYPNSTQVIFEFISKSFIGK